MDAELFSTSSGTGGLTMLSWAMVCLSGAVMAGVIGFNGLIGPAVTLLGQVLFFTFLVLLSVPVAAYVIRQRRHREH
ncbi:hypothetical protein QQM79_02310 [Marinobacteraceae bacterium S3BR75-40.1]